MRMNSIMIILFLLLTSNFYQSMGEEAKTKTVLRTNLKSLAAPCARGNTITYLSYNNVNTPVHLTGTMWTDPDGQAGYEIPKGSGLKSLYAGGIWIAGTDVNEQLK
ncbi:hypothetical protein ACFLSY_02470, partial [Bacteroidota bacterium]